MRDGRRGKDQLWARSGSVLRNGRGSGGRLVRRGAAVQAGKMGEENARAAGDQSQGKERKRDARGEGAIRDCCEQVDISCRTGLPGLTVV